MEKDASREEIIEAAKIAQCDHFIRPFLKDMTQLFLAKWCIITRATTVINHRPNHFSKSARCYSR